MVIILTITCQEFELEGEGGGGDGQFVTVGARDWETGTPPHPPSSSSLPSFLLSLPRVFAFHLQYFVHSAFHYLVVFLTASQGMCDIFCFVAGLSLNMLGIGCTPQLLNDGVTTTCRWVMLMMTC